MIEPAELHDLAAPAVALGARTAWSLDDVDWTALRADRLTDSDVSVVKFITLIEDHIPGYVTYFIDAFPMRGPDLTAEQYAFNREYFRFLVAWAYDEERHAAALSRYQVSAGIRTRAELITELAEHGRKTFELPYKEPLQIFTYTLLQEKITQLFYQRFRQVAAEPLLRDLLSRLSRDESRHFAFYSQLVTAGLQRQGVSAVPLVREVLDTFRMPLADLIPGYARWFLQIKNATDYDHVDAYPALLRVVQDATKGTKSADVEDMIRFVGELRRLP
jgi:hypothetical protein